MGALYFPLVCDFGCIGVGIAIGIEAVFFNFDPDSDTDTDPDFSTIVTGYSIRLRRR
jgi:hypothetical protein